MDWKLLVVAPLCVTFLAACGHNSDDPPTHHSPYAGLWVDESSVQALDGCDGSQGQGAPFDAVRIDDAGQVFQYTFAGAGERIRLGTVADNGEFVRNVTSPGVTAYGFNYAPSQVTNATSLQDGVFGTTDANHIYLTDNIQGYIQRSFERTTDGNLKSNRVKILTCLGRYNLQQPARYQQDPRYGQAPAEQPVQPQPAPRWQPQAAANPPPAVFQQPPPPELQGEPLAEGDPRADQEYKR